MSQASEFIQQVYKDQDAVNAMLIGNMIKLSGTAMLIYDYFLTLSDEIRLIWYSSFNLATLLFAIIRYGPLVSGALNTGSGAPRRGFNSGPWAAVSCQILFDSETVIIVMWTVAVSAFVAFRIMALWSRNWCLGIALFVAGLVNSTQTGQIVYMFWFRGVSAPSPLPGCVQITSDEPSADIVQYYMPIVTSSINLAYELLCLVLTLVKTCQVHRLQQAHASLRSQATISTHLSGYGSAYFTVMLLLGISNIAASMLPDDNLFATYSACDLNRALYQLFVPILTTRFIMDLRRAAGGSGLASSSDFPRESSLVFGSRTERLLEPLGGPCDVFEDRLILAEALQRTMAGERAVTYLPVVTRREGDA